MLVDVQAAIVAEIPKSAISNKYTHRLNNLDSVFLQLRCCAIITTLINLLTQTGNWTLIDSCQPGANAQSVAETMSTKAVHIQQAR